MANPPKQIVQLRIELRGIEPKIWRRVQVPSDFTLRRVHDVIQATFVWLDLHVHEFNVVGRRYGMPEVESDDWGGPPLHSSSNIKLSQVLEWGINRFLYVYDFGDDWIHDISVEKLADPDEETEYPILVAGDGRAPPENVGGPPGFYAFIEAMLDQSHPDHENAVEWYGYELFDPRDIELEVVEAQLNRIRAQRRKGPRK